MKERLFKLLGVEPGEESMVSMLLIQSIFLGIFFGAFDISAHSLFLSVFDEKAMARAYVISGLAGIVLTSGYTWLQARIRFSPFAVGNLIFVSLLTFLLWLSVILFPGKLVTFAVFVLLGPLNILAMLGFWGTTGRLFTLRQGKRLFGIVDTGLIGGIIISCYGIPLILAVGFDSHNILLAGTVSLLIAVILQVMIGSRFQFAATGNISDNKKEKKSGLSHFRNDSYIRIMGIFVALSVMTAFFVQYSFMAVTRLQYPQEEDMARFLGLFTGSMMIFTILIKLFLFSYIIRNYGLRICLALTPVLVAGFTVIAILIGMTMGYTPASANGFMVFFLILALSRLFSKALKDSIESPSFKVIYQTVDEKIRYEVQSGVDGTVNEISALSSGLLLAGLGALTFVKLVHFSWVLFFIIAAWIFVAFRLYSEYRNSIRRSLEEKGHGDANGKAAVSPDTTSGRTLSSIEFENNYFRIINGDYSFLDSGNAYWNHLKIVERAESASDICLLPALRMIGSRNDADEGLRYRAIEVAEKLEEIRRRSLKPEKPDHSSETERIFRARGVLSDTRMPQTTEILRLLRDNNPETRKLALFMIGKFRLADMIPDVCNCLAVPALEKESYMVLESFGTEACSSLIRLFMSSSGNLRLSLSVIRLLGKSADRESCEFLFARLWSNTRKIRELASMQLISCGYRAAAEDRDKLHQLVSDVAALITWNISVQVSLERAERKDLLEMMRRETASWTAFLFNILSITYDRSSVEKIRTNIESGTAGSVNYALEMIDIVVEDSIKPKLVALLDVVPDEDKLRNLQHFFQGEATDYQQTVEDIINRDYNLLGIWVRACALRATESIDNDNLWESVTALLFSPEKILREEAARLCKRNNPARFEMVSSRMRSKQDSAPGHLAEAPFSEKDLIFNKVEFLLSVFSDISGDELLELAEALDYTDDAGSKLSLKEGEVIVWPAEIRSADTRPVIMKVFDPEALKKESWYFPGGGVYILPVKAVAAYLYQHPGRKREISDRIEY